MESTRTADRWRERRRYLNTHRARLTALAAALYGGSPRVAGTYLLTRPEWLPGRPVPLADVRLVWADPPPAVAVTGREPQARGVLPGAAAGHGCRSYAQAVAALDPPHLFVNRPVYRLAGADLAGTDPAGADLAGTDPAGTGLAAVPRARIAFAAGRYFDLIDVGEAAAHELAAAVLDGRYPLPDVRHGAVEPAPVPQDALPLRSLVGDPTSPDRRSMPVAVTTLTIRHDSARATARFLAHWRDPAKVATNPGMYQVVPVGMFQPAGNGPGTATPAAGGEAEEFDLWRCMVREYSEELLGAPEHAEVSYATWPLFRALEQARAAGTCRPYVLGIGVDPLTLATDVLAVVVFEAGTFDALFGEVVAENAEGRIVMDDQGSPGLPFTGQHVDRLVRREHTQPAGAAVLRLAWRYRDQLLVPPTSPTG